MNIEILNPDLIFAQNFGKYQGNSIYTFYIFMKYFIVLRDARKPISKLGPCYLSNTINSFNEYRNFES